MSFSSNGFRADVDEVLNVKPTAIIAEITSKAGVVYCGKTTYKKDCTERVCLMNPYNEVLNKGDTIDVKSFYIKNRNGRIRHQFDTIVITEWQVVRRNKYIKRYYGQKTDEEVLEEKLRQRQAIEEELEAEEQDLDEYIENIDENNPF